jgi:hypothetical protein
MTKQPPIPASMLVLLVLVAMGLIVGAIALAFSGSTRFQSGVQVQLLRESFRGVPPPSGSRMLYSDESRFDECGSALYFDIYITRSGAEAVQTHYQRQFQQRGWVTDPRTGNTYLNETMQVDIVQPVPQAIGGAQIPPNILAARQLDTTMFAVVVTGWRGDLCPNLNRSSRLSS